MKIIKSLFAFAAFFALNSVSAKTITAKWPQIKAYHEVMTKSYKASKDGNLKTVKNNLELLTEKAEALSVENMPEEFRNPKTIETLLLLKKKTVLLDQLMKEKASDNDIKKALSELDQTFKKIVKMCQPEKK